MDDFEHLTPMERKTVAGLQADGNLMAPNAYSVSLWRTINRLRGELRAIVEAKDARDAFTSEAYGFEPHLTALAKLDAAIEAARSVTRGK